MLLQSDREHSYGRATCSAAKVVDLKREASQCVAPYSRVGPLASEVQVLADSKTVELGS